MRTAIFVYKTTSITISTNETNLELCSMDAAPVPLSAGSRTLAPGIYKIVSDDDVGLTGDPSGDPSAFEFVADTNNKTSIPTPPPNRAAESFPSLDISALPTFFAVPEAKGGLNHV